MPTEVPLTPFVAGDGIEGVGQGASPSSRFGGPYAGVWTVPDGVESFSVLFAGGGSGTLTSPSYAQVWRLRNIPCTPGDEWLLEAGGPPWSDNPTLATLGNGQWHGGQGNGSNDNVASYAGGGASTLSTRSGLVAVGGGRGGALWVSPGVGGPGFLESADVWPQETGSLDVGEDQPSVGSLYFAGGGAAGAGPGAKGDDMTPPWQTGENGGSVVPVGMQTGAPSPRWIELDVADSIYGGVVLIYWYSSPRSRGWNLGRLGG